MSEEEKDGHSALEIGLTTVLSGGTLVAVGRVAALGLGFALQLVMARYLTSSAYGEVILVIAVVGFIASVSKLGLDDGILHLFPKWEDDPGRAHEVVRASLVLALISGSIVGVCLFVLAPYLSDAVFDNSSLNTLFRVSAVVVPFLTVTAVAVSFARSIEDARVHTYVDQLIRPGARFVLIAALVLGGFRALGAVVGHVVGIVLASLLALSLIRESIPSRERGTRRMYRPVLVYSLPLIVSEGLNSFVTNVDIYFLGYFLNSSIVGEYNIALQISNLFYPVLFSFSFLLPPVLTRLNKNDQQSEMVELYQIVTKWVVIFTLPLLVLFLFVPRTVVGLLFGSNYTGAATALRVLAVGNFFSVAVGLINASLIALGRNRTVAFILGFQFCVNVILDVVLIPEIGATGAAVATTAAVVLNNVVGAVVLYRWFGVHPVARSWFSLITAVLGVSALSYVVVTAVHISTSLAVLAVGLLYPFIVVAVAIDPADETIVTLIEDRTNAELGFVRGIIHRLS
jgi:O-antigen/teichoic acid export membrane protein